MDDSRGAGGGAAWSDDDDAPPPSAPLGQEFFFHLYRGSELLKENEVDQAKGELERALALQPRDAEGQSLLGVVYFRLGHYPRAIRIYQDLIRARPSEIAPKVNLALCHLKTARPDLARSLLEEVIQARPDHLRAWGYLGLAHQRLGNLEEAGIAFERSGHPKLADRLKGDDSGAGDRDDRSSQSDIQEITQSDARNALRPSLPPPGPAPVAAPIDPPASVPGAVWAPSTRIAVPPTLDELTREAALVFPEEPRVALHSDGWLLVRIDGAFNARADLVRAALPDEAFETTALMRSSRGVVGEEPLGGGSAPVVSLRGSGRLVLGPLADGRLAAFDLAGDTVFVRESHLAGFDASLGYETGRFPVNDQQHAPVVRLAGNGMVAVAHENALLTLEVRAGSAVRVRSDSVVGWRGRLLAQTAPATPTGGSMRDLVEFSGEGLVVLDAV